MHVVIVQQKWDCSMIDVIQIPVIWKARCSSSFNVERRLYPSFKVFPD